MNDATCAMPNELGFIELVPEYVTKIMGQVPERDVDPYDISDIDANLDLAGFPRNLRQNGLEFKKPFKAPKLLGNTIQAHFEKMAEDLAGPSQRIISRFVRKAELSDLPEPVNLAELIVPHTSAKPWLRLTAGEKPSYHKVPEADLLILDFETFVRGSLHDSPIIGAAIGFEKDGTISYWLWAHECLLRPELPYVPALAPVGEGKVIIMHNASFDAALIEERYTLNSLNNWMYCTQAMHTTVAGLDGNQRWAKNMDANAPGAPGFLKWGSGASLVQAYKFHTGKNVAADAKDPRGLFVIAETMAEIAAELERCLQYALSDVRLTMELFQALWPKYLHHVPSLVARIGHNMLTNAVVTIRDDWHAWLANCEQQYQQNEQEIADLLNGLADRYHEEWARGELDPEADPWLRNLDWRPSKLFDDRRVAMWYEPKAVFGEKLDIGGKTDLAHYLMKLCWKGLPMQKSREKGWHTEQEKVLHKNFDGSFGSFA